MKFRSIFDKNQYTHETKSAFMTSVLFLSFIFVSFFVCAATDSFKTFHAANLLFTVLWSFFFCALIIVLPRRAGRIVYTVLYFFFLIYGLSQYIYYQIFNKLFSFTVISNFSEGAGYLGASIACVEPLIVMVFAALFALGVYVIVKMKDIIPITGLTRVAAIPATFLILVLSQFTLPRTYGEKSNLAVWNSFEDARYIYDHYTDPHKLLGLSGYYQYMGLDFYNCFVRPLTADTASQEEEIDSFFAQYGTETKENEMTGLFEGKNVILVMMESMDELAISEENTPSIYKMMNEGINFTNYYASVFGDGATFSNEFVLNTGVYSPSNGTAAYAYINNYFSQSLPNLFKKKGYSANSFHHNHGWFYNRMLMHNAFGYDHYYSYYDYSDDKEEVIIDTFLTRNPALMEQLLGGAGREGQPFMSFVISYSAHLPYTYEGELSEYAFAEYVSPHETLGKQEDLDCLMAKARITDAMLGELIEQIDENTVVVCVADHFAYGLEEETLLDKKGEQWALRQKVPFFIYTKDPDFKGFAVDKVCSNADFLPTIANLFALELAKPMMGRDIFDEDYRGYVIFSNYSYLTEELYWHDQVIEEYDSDYDESYVHHMIEYLYNRMRVNDYLLSTDYYKGP
ncbi:MAG: sulfatase-like hydrolase/transferase [Clostridiales bacterium]|nr:sulfatase-like hydrolase/transferase [Clostridiales bacterium]